MSPSREPHGRVTVVERRPPWPRAGKPSARPSRRKIPGSSTLAPTPRVSPSKSARSARFLAAQQRRARNRGQNADPSFADSLGGLIIRKGWDGAECRFSSGPTLGPRPPADCLLCTLRHARIKTAGIEWAPELSRFPRGLLSPHFFSPAIIDLRRLQSSDPLWPRWQCKRSFHPCVELIPALQGGVRGLSALEQ